MCTTDAEALNPKPLHRARPDDNPWLQYVKFEERCCGSQGLGSRTEVSRF